MAMIALAPCQSLSLALGLCSLATGAASNLKIPPGCSQLARAMHPSLLWCLLWLGLLPQCIGPDWDQALSGQGPNACGAMAADVA